MKRVALSALLLLVGTGQLSAQESTDTLTGDRLLERAKAAYAQLTSYAGVTSVISELALGDTMTTEATNAAIYFSRPGRLRISGRDTKGKPYLVISDGMRTRAAIVESDLKARKGWIAFGPILGLQQARGDTLANDTLSTSVAVAMVTGIGNRAPFYVPALLGLTEGSPLAHHTPAVLVGRDTVAGVECYKVVIGGASVTRTYWLELRSFLLRQMEDEQSGPQLTGMFKQLGERMAKEDTSSNRLVAGIAAGTAGLLQHMPHAQGASFLVRFLNVRVNSPMDPKLFALPAAHAPEQG